MSFARMSDSTRSAHDGPKGGSDERCPPRATSIIGPTANILRTLLVVEQEVGYVPMEAIASIAKRLGVTEADVIGVLSYYPDLHTAPRGRHIVRLCTGEARVANGSLRLLTELNHKLDIEPGETRRMGSLPWNGSIVSAIAEWVQQSWWTIRCMAASRVPSCLRFWGEPPANVEGFSAFGYAMYSLMAITLYISNDTSAKAAGADRLAAAWAISDVELIRTSTRGALPSPNRWSSAATGRPAAFFWPRAKPWMTFHAYATAWWPATFRYSFPTGQQRVVFSDFGMSEPLSLVTYRAQGGWGGMYNAIDLSPEAIIAEIKVSALRGCGGAAFPVWRKWDVARQTDAHRSMSSLMPTKATPAPTVTA